MWVATFFSCALWRCDRMWVATFFSCALWRYDRLRSLLYDGPSMPLATQSFTPCILASKSESVRALFQ